ncbi:MAG TPA: polyprenyl synthetase family protein [Chitinophagaceae bacterium]|nr:polyprenyl synthetase family protein [Chitinophagaceae bacterium]
MLTFQELSQSFSEKFNNQKLSDQPGKLYEAADYFLGLGGKRIRPVMCLMGSELFDDINPDAWHAAMAIELFHNFTLIHDDIMDKSSLRRGQPTVHMKYGDATALLSGDLMLVAAYDHLNKIDNKYLHRIMHLFNKTGRQVCEGQQLDMDFEQQENVQLDEYIHMIGLKTSVLLAASLQMGAILGGASLGNQQHLYEFGKNLGIAFQIQDDYLDAFGDPQKFGKEIGGDIRANKKTFLVIRAMEVCSPEQKKQLQELLSGQRADKVEQVLRIFRDCGVDGWARDLKQQFTDKAFQHLEDTAVISKRKEPLQQLARYLMQRES